MRRKRKLCSRLKKIAGNPGSHPASEKVLSETMTNMQLYFVIGISALISIMNTGILILYINYKFSDLEDSLEKKGG